MDGTLIQTTHKFNGWPVYVADYGTRNPIEPKSGMRKRFGVLIYEKNPSEPWYLFLAPDDYPFNLENLQEVRGRSKYVVHGVGQATPFADGSTIIKPLAQATWVVEDSSSDSYYFPGLKKSAPKSMSESDLIALVKQAQDPKVGIRPNTARADLKALQGDLNAKIGEFNAMLGAGGEAKYADKQRRLADEQRRKEAEKKAQEAKRIEDARKAAELQELQRKLKEEEARRIEAERKLRESENKSNSDARAASERLAKIAAPAGFQWVSVPVENTGWNDIFDRTVKAHKGTFMAYFRVETTPGDQRHPGTTSASDPIARGRIGNDWYITTVIDINRRISAQKAFEEVQLLLTPDNTFGDRRQHRHRWVGFEGKVPSDALKAGILGNDVTYAIRGYGGYAVGYTTGSRMFRLDGEPLPANMRNAEILVVR